MKQIKKKLKKVTPMFTRILTTADVYSKEDALEHGIMNPKKVGMIKDIQKIVAIGNSCRFVKPGDIVSLNYTRYGRSVQRKDSLKAGIDEHYNAEMVFDINVLTVNDEKLLFLDEGDVQYIVDEFTEEEIEVNTSGLILN